VQKPTLIQLTAAQNYKHALVVKHYAGMNIYKALEANSPSVGMLSRKDPELIKQCIKKLLDITSQYFDQPLKLNKLDILVEEILANYNYRQLKLEDILAICNEIKESEIFKITPARFLRTFANYTKRREALCIERSQIRSQDMKSLNGTYNIDQRVQKSIKSVERTTKHIIKGRLKRN
jgi:hypothetical protein